MKRTNTNITDSLWFAILGGLVFVFLVALFAASTSTACGYMSDVPQPTQKPIAYKTTMSDDTTTYASLYADVYPTIDSTHLSFYDTTRVVKKPYESTDTSDVEAYIHKKIARSTLCRYYNDRFQSYLQSFLKNEACLGHRALESVNKQDATICHIEHAFYLTAEVGVSRGVYNIDFCTFPID